MTHLALALGLQAANFGSQAVDQVPCRAYWRGIEARESISHLYATSLCRGSWRYVHWHRTLRCAMLRSSLTDALGDRGRKLDELEA
eukprot:CAMPEP_0181245004 /NCGR_PEP_ID=MMETSP1096-20121128/43176_1 /TAXON_ID=156174 ORGANISM="Chrysochromulina ericina, Strain CCMP281" /NCGR_SAMPLE_ID=MMETSP1096 /ASSEMBLY_ACC=CAM_ASM_000453 /LENGTH=85 /DNA_ID=CAMNT_0023341619 /DNA_START=369 /DNA_END=627 /DNA_ORIENTATION=+